MQSDQSTKKIFGIIGGMGPLASIKFYQDIIKYYQRDLNITDNSKYPYLRITNLPVPDLINDTSRVGITKNMIIKELQELEKIGTTCFIIVCNTVHIFIDEFRNAISSPILSIVEEATKELNQKGSKKVLLLATPTTIHSNIYQDALKNLNVEVIIPNDKDISFLGDIILKSVGNTQTKDDVDYLSNLIQNYIIKNKIDAILLGCTELSFVIDESKIKINIFNAVSILVKRTAEICLKGK